MLKGTPFVAQINSNISKESLLKFKFQIEQDTIMLTQTKRAAYITRCCASSQHIKGFKLVEIKIHSSMIIYVSTTANGELASMVNV